MTSILNISAIIMAIILVVIVGPLIGLFGAAALYLAGANTSVGLIKGKSADAKRISRGF